MTSIVVLDDQGEACESFDDRAAAWQQCIEDFLGRISNEHTRRAYEQDIRDFFAFLQADEQTEAGA